MVSRIELCQEKNLRPKGGCVLGRDYPMPLGGPFRMREAPRWVRSLQMPSKQKKRDVCYGVGGLSPNRLAWFFGGVFYCFFKQNIYRHNQPKTYQELYAECVFLIVFFKMSCGFGMVCGFIEVCFSLRISVETELWRTNLWVAGDREVTTVISSIYPPTQGCQIQSWHFKRLKFGIPEAKHIYPQDPWDDLYIYLHLVVVFW